MSDPNANDQASAAKAMTAAEAASKVRRTVVEVVDGKDRSGNPTRAERKSKVRVEASEVLAHADHGTHVVVVTKDGQKLSSAED
ncbi:MULTISPECIES: hypothetical protein [unclassified Variovorax]|uniref:hypothetical protein n=1 Tax=unclassified Variovorax TaxID=663243 RepID=UPI003F460763